MVEERRSDEELVQAYLVGENTAFDRLVERYQSRLIPFAYEITKNYEDAKDAVQETCLVVWQKIRTFEVTRKFSSWLYKICRNRSLNKVREKHREFKPLPENIERLRPGPLREWAEDKATHDRILAVLNHRDHRLYNLVMVKGRPYEAIPQEEKLFKDMTPEQIRVEFDRVLGIVWERAEKEKDKWRGKIHHGPARRPFGTLAGGDAENTEKI